MEDGRAELEVALSSTSQAFATDLATRKFQGFTVKVRKVTANAVEVELKCHATRAAAGPAGAWRVSLAAPAQRRGRPATRHLPRRRGQPDRGRQGRAAGRGERLSEGDEVETRRADPPGADPGRRQRASGSGRSRGPGWRRRRSASRPTTARSRPGCWSGTSGPTSPRRSGGEARFEVKTENAVAGVRGTTFRVDAASDKLVVVRVYSGTVAVAGGGAAPPGARGAGGRGAQQVPGPRR